MEDRSQGLKLPHIHPSKGFQRQPSTCITHSHAATNQIFCSFPLVSFPPRMLRVCISGKHGCGDVCWVVRIFRGTTFSLNSCFPSRRFEWRRPPAYTANTSCGAPSATSSWFCLFSYLHIYLHLCVCLVKADIALLCIVVGKILKRFVPKLDLLHVTANITKRFICETYSCSTKLNGVLDKPHYFTCGAKNYWLYKNVPKCTYILKCLCVVSVFPFVTVHLCVKVISEVTVYSAGILILAVLCCQWT